MAPRLVSLARHLRREQTAAEDILWAQLRNRRLAGWKFRRQSPAFGYVPDFYCAEARLTIEVDGIHHNDQIERDRARTLALQAYGLTEIRFSNQDVSERLPWVVREIRRMLDIARADSPRSAYPRYD